MAAALPWTLVACSAERGSDSGSGRQTEILVFAAASLSDAVTEVGEAFEAQSGVETVFNFAGSNVLALQIEASGAADVFASADVEWMDYLQGRGRLLAGTRTDFLSNRLVVVAHRDADYRIDRLADLAELDFRYLSIADPAAVPAGRYARRALSQIGPAGQDLWQKLESRLAPAGDVRAALAAVEARRDVVGIVYATDVTSNRRVRVLAEIPQPPAPPIRYQVAAIDHGPEEEVAESTLQFLEFLTNPKAATIFRTHGFAP